MAKKVGLLVLFITLMISVSSVQAVVTQLQDPDTEVLGDTQFQENLPAAFSGTNQFLTLGNHASSRNMTQLYKFNISGLTNIEDALLVITIGEDYYDVGDILNFTVTGIENQTWDENDVNYLTFIQGAQTVMGYNDSHSGTELNDTVFLNITLQWNVSEFAIAREGDENITFMVNISQFLDEQGDTIGTYSKEFGDMLVRPYLNITTAAADTTPPNINITSPMNITYGFGIDTLDYNITVSEDLSTALYSIDEGVNFTMGNDSITSYFNLSGNHDALSDAQHQLTIFVNDTAGNGNSTTVEFTIDSEDTVPPNINITVPQNQTLTNASIDFNITVSESLSAAVYSLNGGTNFTMTNDSVSSYFNVSSNHPELSDAQYELVIYVNDTVGNGNSTSVVFTIALPDTTPPNIVINFPTNDTHTTGDLDYNVTVSESLSAAVFSINGTVNATMTNDSFSKYFNLSGNHPTLGNGFHELVIYVNDTAGNGNSTTIAFTVSVGVVAANGTCNVGDFACGGDDATYILQCLDDDGNGVAEWSNTNRTYCPGGCSAGACVNIQDNCVNQCNVSIDHHVCGGINDKYSINCTTNANGCQVWNFNNQSYCEYGCSEGFCLNGTNTCIPGSERCFGSYILSCGDPNNDGFFEWDTTNTTLCTNECFIEVDQTTGIQTASCEFGSGNLTHIYLLQDSFEELGLNLGFLFPNEAWRAGFVLAATLVLWGWVSVKGSWEIGTILSIGLIGAATFFAWVPIYLGLVFIMLGGLIIYMGVIRGGGNET